MSWKRTFDRFRIIRWTGKNSKDWPSEHLTVDRIIQPEYKQTPLFRGITYLLTLGLSKGSWYGTKALAMRMFLRKQPLMTGVIEMKGVLLWLVGIPIPIIILLYIFNIL